MDKMCIRDSSDGALSFKEDFKDPESIVFHLYARIPDDMNCLSNNNVYRIVTTSQGEDVYKRQVLV